MLEALFNTTTVSGDIVEHLAKVAIRRGEDFNGKDCSSATWASQKENHGKPQVHIGIVEDVERQRAWMFEASHPFIYSTVEFENDYFPDDLSNGDIIVFTLYDDELHGADAIHKFDEDQYKPEEMLSLADHLCEDGIGIE